MDVTAPSAAPDGFDVFRRAWDTQIGEAWPLPPGLDIGSSGDFRVKAQAVKAHDVVIADFHNKSFVGRPTGARDGDRVIMHLMRRGAWRFTPTDDRRAALTVPAGFFVARHNGPSSSFDVDPDARGKILIMPVSVFAPLSGGAEIVGSVRSAEARRSVSALLAVPRPLSLLGRPETVARGSAE